jgi:hypothetical protein
LSHFLAESATLYIIGGNGYALTRWLYPWRWFLKRALRKKCTIHYLLTTAEWNAGDKLSKIKHDLEAGTEGKIEFYLVSSDRVDAGDRKLVESLRTFHPLLFETDDKRVMWIEDYHPENSTVAYACEFVPPNKAAHDKRFDRYKEILARLVDKYGGAGLEVRAA